MTRRSGWRERVALLREGLLRLGGTLRPRRRDADLEEELRLHAEMAAEVEGRRPAGATQAMEALRDQRGWPWLGSLVRDGRFAARGLRRTPGFTLTVLATLAVGIGGTTAVFSVVKAVLLDPLAYPASDRIVALAMKAPGAPGVADVSGDLRLSASMFFTFSEHNRTFDHLGVWSEDRSTVIVADRPEEVRTVGVSDGVLQTLAVSPAIGRWLEAGDQVPGSPKTALLGFGYWQRRFGGAVDVIGRRVRIDDEPVEIVGVMPRGFNIADVYPDVILATRFNRGRAILPGFGYNGVARLRSGVDLAAADADIARMIPIWMRSWPMVGGLDPRVYEQWRITPALTPLKQHVIGTVGSVLWVVMGTVALLLVIACANVAGLLLVRADARQQELAVRGALGAGRARLVQSLLVESLLLGLTAGVVGLGLAFVALRALATLHPPNLPRLAEIGIDAPVFAFALVLSIAASALFGVVPSWRSTGTQVTSRLGGGVRGSIGTRERRRVRDLLVASQVAIALVLLVGTGLMFRTIRALGEVDPGFSGAADAETLQTSISSTLVPDGPALLQLQHDLVDRLAALPGVTAAGFANALPLDGQPRDWDDVLPEGHTFRTGEMPAFRLFKWISPGYFAAAGTAIVAGRDYTWTDLADRRPVAIISAALAREFWGSPAAALGRRMRTLDTSPWREVVGVAADTRDNGMDQPPPATVYWPAYTESLYAPGKIATTRDLTIVVRSARAGTAGLRDEIAASVQSVNHDLPIASVQTMATIYDASLARPSFALTMLMAAGAMGLLLGVVGLYGVVSYAGAQRRREVGIRVALGAERAAVTRLFLRQGLIIATVGIAAGLPVAVAASRLIQALLFETRPLDPLTYAAVAVVLAIAAAAASYVPARRAAAIDPVRALKE